MSGETEASVSGWTTDTLHTHFIRQLDLLREAFAEQRRADDRAREIAFRAQETAMAAALASAKEAVAAAMAAAERASEKTDASSEKRFESVNEFRAQQADIIRTFMPRTEAEAIIQRLTDQFRELTETLSRTISRAEMEAQHQRDQERIAELGTRLTRVESLAQGAQANKTAVFAALGIATTLIVAVIVVLNYVTSGH